jgi:hypothetical protein
MTTDQVIRIYRKTAATPSRKPTKAQADQVRKVVAIKCRVQRPGLLDHFLSGAFHKQTAIPAQVIDNRADRIINHHKDGWTVPADSLGRNGRVDASTAQSILLWVKQNIPTVDPSEVSVVVEPAKF